MGRALLEGEARLSKYWRGRSFVRLISFFFKSGPTPASVRLFLVFSSTNFTENTLGFIRIQTRIVEGEHADHLTTTTALSVISCIKNTCPHCATILLGTFNVKHTLPKT